jgi:glycerol 3-phosphatase-2
MLEIASEFDFFIFDAFGVLVLGDTAIPSAPAVLAALKAAGKSTCILSNAATQDRAAQFAKYSGLGFPVAEGEIVTSRSVLASAVADLPDIRNWAAILPPGGSFSGLRGDIATPHTDVERFWKAEGYLFLSTNGWTTDLQHRLVDRLTARPAPVLVGNPDLVAPREHGLSIEPGFFAHDILDRTPGDVRFFGKPFANAFDAAIAVVEAGRGRVDRSRVAMVGDTLHTDILGGASAGLGTVLVTDHGVLKGHEPEALIEQSGIRPNWIVTAI